MTYVCRIYSPFLRVEPVVQQLSGAGNDGSSSGSGGGWRVALWTFQGPADAAAGLTDSQSGARLGAALLVPALANLPAALDALPAALREAGMVSMLF